MGLRDRLRAWLRRFWSGSRACTGTAGTEGEAASGYECAVCGTGVDDPEEPCPLCRSTDVVRAETTTDAAPDAGTDAAPDAGTDAAPEAGDRQHVAAGDDASVDRLRELREDGELLEEYSDRWRPVDGGFRVETSDGTRVVDAREEVVALLRAEDG